ncbi:MAG: hypothetical protein IJP84_00870 [Lachnospiraceae bacterium]|nr:hypothetical protein [Lachnospiraceae bacterium]
MAYEELKAIVGNRLDKVDSAIEALNAGSLGADSYRRILDDYEEFHRTGNVQLFNTLVSELRTRTGVNF